METTNIFQLLGTIGSLIMCASSVPQILKTYRMKCADGLSGSYLTILMIGMSRVAWPSRRAEHGPGVAHPALCFAR